MKPPIDELDVFKPADATLEDENEWPIFPLNDADVTSQQTGELVDLLLADDTNLVDVTGRVGELDRSKKHNLIDRDSLSFDNNVIIPSVQCYSFGQYEDGEAAFWARGRTGWFEIKPSRRYRETYKDMREALQILYFCADLFNEMTTRKQARRTSPETLFEKYANDAEYNCKNAHDARSRFIKHRQPLLKLMKEGKEGIGWKLTAIFRFLNSDPQENAPEGQNTPLQTPPRPTAKDLSSDDEAPAHLARKGKSALRPKTGKGKGKARVTDPIPIDPIDDDDDIVMEDVPRASPLRRKSEDISTDPRPTKRRRGRPPKHKPIAEKPASVPSLLSEIPFEATLPIKDQQPPPRKAPSAKPASSRVDIATTPLPSFEPNSPGDVWACRYDGCSHRVYGASTSQGKHLIEEHWEHHTSDSQAQIDLAYAQERPYLPVGNLINRIKEMAAQQKTVGTAAAKEPAWKRELMELPKAIRQRY